MWELGALEMVQPLSIYLVNNSIFISLTCPSDSLEGWAAFDRGHFNDYKHKHIGFCKYTMYGACDVSEVERFASDCFVVILF